MFTIINFSKYSFCFLLGAVCYYFVFSDTMGSNDDALAHSLDDSLAQSLTHSANLQSVKALEAEYEEKLQALNQQITQLNAQLALATNNVDNPEDSQSNEAQTDETNDDQIDRLTEQLKNEQAKNSALENELYQYNPNRITNEQLKGLLPDKYLHVLYNMQGKNRERFYNFMQKPEDPKWGYLTQQAIRDYVSMHLHADDVKIESLTCKTNRCSILLANAQTRRSLLNDGFNHEQIKEYFNDPENNFAKKVYMDMTTDINLNLTRRRSNSTPNFVFAQFTQRVDHH